MGVGQIAAAVGIKAPSLYKHYKGKQDIFEAIFRETSRRYDTFADSLAFPWMKEKQDTKVVSHLDVEVLVEKAVSFMQYSLHDEFVSQFRRMVTIEQFRSTELSDIYSQRYVGMLFSYYQKLFQYLIDSGVMPKKEASTLAVMYGSPFLVLIGECDRHPDKEEECMKALEAHVRLFYSLIKSEVSQTTKGESDEESV